ncbi:MAG: hypothetical protein ISR83_00910 [Candidatus Marinimicrobia bacterium]|nr:hypothetical protein [Candidatus Neomarinimicrobiota bacterium]
MRNSIFNWVALISGVLLLIPLIAMQFTHEVNWDYIDFIIMGLMLFTAGSLIVLVYRNISGSRRIYMMILIIAIFITIWIELAVGIFSRLV